MNYCSQCAAPLTRVIPDGDDRLRHVCTACRHVHYQNPRVVTGTLPVHGERVLLCKRAIAPRLGFWTLPAGFLENGESTDEGAVRETWEEALARVEIDGLYTLFNLPQIAQVHLFFRARLLNLDFAAGVESIEVRLFSEAEIPWQQLAFPVVSSTLRHYFADRLQGSYPLRIEDLRWERDPTRQPAAAHEATAQSPKARSE